MRSAAHDSDVSGTCGGTGSAVVSCMNGKTNDSARYAITACVPPLDSASGRTGDLFGQVPAPEPVRWPRQQSATACSPTMRWAQTLERPCLRLRFLQSLAPPSSPAGPLVYSQLGQWRGIGCSALQKGLQNHPIHPCSLPHRPTAGRHAVADPGRARTFVAPDRRAAN